MKILPGVLLILVCSLIALSANAECKTVAEARLDDDCVVMQFGEQSGVWFRLDKAEMLRKAWTELPELRLQASKYGVLLQQRDAQLSLYREAAREYKGVIRDLKEVNKYLVTETREAREERNKARAALNAWYRSPFLWFGSGVVVTVITGLVVALTL